MEPMWLEQSNNDKESLLDHRSITVLFVFLVLHLCISLIWFSDCSMLVLFNQLIFQMKSLCCSERIVIVLIIINIHPSYVINNSVIIHTIHCHISIISITYIRTTITIIPFFSPSISFSLWYSTTSSLSPNYSLFFLTFLYSSTKLFPFSSIWILSLCSSFIIILFPKNKNKPIPSISSFRCIKIFSFLPLHNLSFELRIFIVNFQEKHRIVIILHFHPYSCRII